MVTPVSSFCDCETNRKKLMGVTRAYIFHRKPRVKTFNFCTGTLVPLETSAGARTCARNCKQKNSTNGVNANVVKWNEL